MKKIFLSALMLCASVVGMTGAEKVLINPGHGGYDSDDRGIPMPLSVPMFWESEGNLTRGLYLRDFMTEMGVSYSITRVTNTSADDLNLTYIATLSNNYGGRFISLHTNGGTASANYTIAFFRGATSSPYGEVISPSKAMGLALAQEHHNHMITNETYTTPRSQSDYAFWGWNYGVLRTNNRAGYLIEAWFHDYRPETLRLKSDHYNKFLAWQTARAFQKSPGGVGTLKGCIIGDVRDLTKSCGYTNYDTRGRDSYLAINNATVTLYNSSGTQLQQVKTDSYCNGVFAFFGLATGTYTIKVTGVSGYKTAEATVSVTTNEASVKQMSLTAGTDTGISFNPTTTGYGATPVGNVSGKTITVTGSGLSGTITVTNSDNTNFWVKETSLPASGGTLNITYKPQSKGSHSTTITCKSGDKTATCVVTGTAYNAAPTFTEGWNYSETSGKKAAWMANYTNYRNMVFNNGKLYVVDYANAVIKVINARTAEHIKDLDMTGVADGALKVLDVDVVDGKLVASNIATKNDDVSIATLKVYTWENDNSAPKCILNTTNLGGMNRVGDAINIKGNLTNGEICYMGQYADANGKTANALVTYAITNGVVSTTPKVAEVDGFVIGGSPRLIPYGNEYIAVGQNYRPSIVTGTGELTKSLTSDVLQACQGNDMAMFTFKGDTYAFATDYDPGTAGDANTMLYNGRAALINLSDGWTDATRVAYYPSTGFSSKTRNSTWSSSICVDVNGNEGVEMWVLVHNQGIAYYKHGTPATYDPNAQPDPEPETPVTPPAEPGVSAPTLTKVWGYETGLPTAASSSLGSSQAAYGTGYNGTIYALDKSTTSILSWNKDAQKQTYLTDSRFAGVAITCDDAGNLLVSSGIYGSSAYKWYIVSAADKSVKEVVVSNLTSATSTNATNVFGRVVGNMLSSEGAYIYTTQAAISTVNCIKIANGAFVSLTKSTAATDQTLGQTEIAQPSLETVSAINASGKASECFYLRVKGTKLFYKPNGSSMTKLSIPANAYYTEGGDVFTLGEKTYVIYPTGNGASAHGSAFAIMEMSSGDVVAEEKASVATVGTFQSIVSEKVSETKANIYQYYAGGKVAMYTFEVPGLPTGIENVEAEVDVPVEYYNLQGIKVANPSNGLFIKKQGDKTTKVIL